MSLKSLATETMVALSAAWLDPARDRKTLASLPLVAPLLPSLQAAHAALLATQVVASPNDAAIAKLKAQAAALDETHDRKVRGILGALEAFADLADDPADAKAFLDLRDLLFPDGIAFVNRDYAHEAGNATLAEQRVGKADKKLLAKLPIPGGKLQDAVDAWIGSAKALGVLDGKRASLEGAAAAATANDRMKARNQWVRAANALLGNLDLDEKATPEILDHLLAPLRDAESKAARRRPAASEKTEPTTTATASAPTPAK